MTDLFGQALAPVSRSVLPAKAMSSQMSATYGRSGSNSSASAALSLSLASRLQARTRLLGSTMFALTWKARVTPSGRSIPALRASVRRTSDSDFTSWPTPRTPTGGPELATRKQELGRIESGGSDLQAVALLAGWPTPTKQDQSSSGVRDYPATATHHAGTTLTDAAKLATWPTPMAGTPAQKGYNEAGNTDYSRRVVELAAWATPQTRDHKGSPTKGPHDRGLKGPPLNEQVRLVASGTTPNGSLAATAKPAQLDPAFSRWLMGLPKEWDACAPTATRSVRR